MSNRKLARRVKKRKKPKKRRKNSVGTSTKELKKVFEEICGWVKDQGCKVYKHPSKSTVNGSNGYFSSEPSPHIRMALKGRPIKKCLQLIIHEFCHFWQWSENFLDRKDDDGNLIYGKLLDGEELTAKESEKAGKLVRISEYDCEKRTGHVIQMWNLESAFPLEEHRKSAATYNRHIAWSIGDKKKEGSGVFLASYDKLADKLWGSRKFTRWPTLKEMLSPISAKHTKIFDQALAKEKKTKKNKKKRRKRK